MREFKFRAWDKQNKVMVAVDMLGEAMLHIQGAEWENREDFIVTQFTGMYDKNDVEIYGGDIVLAQCSPSGKDKQSAKLHKCEVQWSSLGLTGWSLVMLDHIPGEKWITGYLEVGFKGNAFEVIGNIFDNPELLTTKGEGDPS